MPKNKKSTKLVYGLVENAGKDNEYLCLYDDLDAMFEDDCEDREVLVFKLAFRAKANRTTSTKTTLTRSR